MSFRIGVGKKIGGVHVGVSKSFGGKKGGGGCWLKGLAILFFPITITFLFLRWVYRKTKEQKAIDPDNVWYKRTWGIILLLIIFFPVGLYLLWKYSNWNSTVKWIITGVLSLFMIISMFTGGGNNESESDNSSSSQIVAETTTSTTTETSTEKVTTTTTNATTTTTSIITTTTTTTTTEAMEAETTTTIAQTQAIVEDTTEAPTEEVTKYTTTYVLNKKSHKFHYSGCSSVDDIATQNYGEFTGTRDEVIAQGYEPCGRCEP